MWRNLTSPVVRIALIAAVCAPAASAQLAELTELPGLTPWDASNVGPVVVGENGATGEYFEWTSVGGVVDIGGVIAGGGVGGTPRISDDAMRVGGTDFNTVSGFHELSLYDRILGTWTNLGGIGSSCSTEISSGWGISGDGNHIVGLGWFTGCADAHAMQWDQGGGNTDLGSSVAGESSRANGVNFDGTVAVGWQDGAGREGAVWINGVQTVLAGTSEAQAVSDDGTWVAGIGGSATLNEAYRWSQGTGLEPLGSLGLGGFPRRAASPWQCRETGRPSSASTAASASPPAARAGSGSMARA